MLNELHLVKKGNPDEIFNSYYADVLEVAKKKKIAYDNKEKPLFPHSFYFDEGDKIVFCIVDILCEMPNLGFQCDVVMHVESCG